MIVKLDLEPGKPGNKKGLLGTREQQVPRAYCTYTMSDQFFLRLSILSSVPGDFVHGQRRS